VRFNTGVITQLGPPEDYYRPNLPLSPQEGASLSLNSNNLNLEVRVTGGSAEIRNILTGLLEYSGLNALTVRTSELDPNGLPIPVYPPIGAVHVANPQLMPLPGRIIYEFPFTDNQLRAAVDSYLTAVDDYFTTEIPSDVQGLPIALDRRNRRFEHNTREELLDNFVGRNVRLLFLGGYSLGRISDGERLTLRAEDFKNYSAVDQPLAIIDRSIPENENTTIPPGSRINAVYRAEDCNDTLDPINSPRNYEGDVTRISNRFKIDHADFKREQDVVVHYRLPGSSDLQKRRFALDRFEKWALFKSDITWHFKNWYISGFLRVSDRAAPFVNNLLGPIYPSHHSAVLNDYPTAGRNITPPQPDILQYANGETVGQERPVYSYEIQRLKWKLNRHAEDDFSSEAIRRFNVFHYTGAIGLEEYLKRVASHEIAILKHADESANGNNAQRFEKEKEAFKAQIVCARTYFLYRWLNNMSGLTNPLNNDYAETLIPHTAAFHVHRLDTLYKRAKNEAIRRIIEEGISETWGMVITHRGRLTDAEFFAGHRPQTTTCLGNHDYLQQVWTKYGIDCQRVKSDTSYKRSYGHGRGYSQMGAKTLSVLNLTMLQILHWYLYGVQIRNGYGLGDIITRPGSGTSWFASTDLPAIPLDTIGVQNGYWLLNQVIGADDRENWYLSHNFRANEFCVNTYNQNINLNVNKELVKKLQVLRYKVNSRVDVRGLLSPDSIRVENTNSKPGFEALANQIFQPENVTRQSGNQWDLRV
jgi:hypothetical protein